MPDRPIEERVAERIATVEYETWDQQGAADSRDLVDLVEECRFLRVGADAALKVYEYLGMKKSPLTTNERRILDLVNPVYELARRKA